MVSHSFLNKSRAILIGILILGTLVEVGAFTYVTNYTSFPASSAEMAVFQVGNLTVNPDQATFGQPITVTADVVNSGNYGGTYSANLQINGSVVETKKLTLAANESEQVTFNISESTEAIYNATIGDQSGLFIVSAKPISKPDALGISGLFINPIEAWPGQQINISVSAHNGGSDNISYQLPFLINGVPAQKVLVQLAPGASATVTASIFENNTGSYLVSVGGQSNTLNVVPEGQHTLRLIFNHPVPFTLDGVSYSGSISPLLKVGPHTIVIPSVTKLTVGVWINVDFGFAGWSDGTSDLSKTINLQSELYLVALYIHLGSCPSLYAWNGTSYGYVGDVSDGSGWLGYLEYFNPDGTAVYSYAYPTDYIKMDSTQLKPTNGYYNLTMTELANEIFYADSAKLIAVDHPANVDVYSTTSTFLYNLTGAGNIYTISKDVSPPVSAVTDDGQNVLPVISKMDGNLTAGARWSWNNITLNLGDLSSAKNINLVVGAKITWPTTQAGGSNFMKYQSQPGVMPSPPPYMEVKAANGSWVRVPDNRQFPLPDVTDNMFVVNLTDLFPTNDYELRINTYQDIQFDYIGVDTTPQQGIIAQTVSPSYAGLDQAFTTDSNSSGAFTRYGNVTALLQSDDNQFIIGRQGDEVALQFPSTGLAPVPQGWVRDYFLVANCVFKGSGLPYVPLTVAPLPFQGMTSFPYPANETYPYTAANQAYLQAYDTRVINPP